MTYLDIVNSFESNPRDVHTVPISNTVPRWFYTYVEDGIVYITNAKDHKNSSKLSASRKIDPKQFDAMLDLYYRRCNGEAVSQIATSITACQVYWYGIIAEFD